MTSYTLGQKVIAPTKPDRGVFPLDHKGRWRKEEKNNKKKTSIKYDFTVF